jgi:hypothetical protein
MEIYTGNHETIIDQIIVGGDLKPPKISAGMTAFYQEEMQSIFSLI